MYVSDMKADFQDEGLVSYSKKGKFKTTRIIFTGTKSWGLIPYFVTLFKNFDVLR